MRKSRERPWLVGCVAEGPAPLGLRFVDIVAKEIGRLVNREVGVIHCERLS
jgi:hypothetical protein